MIIWLTGLSGSGKTTIARKLKSKLKSIFNNIIIFDGDELRKGLCSDLGFTDKDRTENVRRVAHIARLHSENCGISIVALISPFAADRKMAKQICEPFRFIEVFVNAPLEICQQRDPKGLYKQKLPLFTGVTSLYEPPVTPNLILNTAENDIDFCVKQVMDLIYKNF